ncbi:hypothetical protein ALP75_204851 [Pseudomonas syringae pv. actinidiae]|nr:hypothetical protein ALP75_204851 [Pseudomonas syringae pv. actinidiae]
MLACECLGFLAGKTLHKVVRGLAGAIAFIDIRRLAGERQAQSGQQFAAVGGAGSKEQGWHAVLRRLSVDSKEWPE